MAHNGPMLCSGPAKTAEAYYEALCSNITQFLIEPPTARMALSICYGRLTQALCFLDQFVREVSGLPESQPLQVF